ncbi:MAG: hypothetical protein B7X04_04425 [Parcubacteria group bacterium 21-54-25]|nr:MAG: hypothetical protein B7X04_04425 [Parcubacteria group bacterium 21-54-25]
MSAVGEAVALPAATGVEVPIPWVMKSDTACVVVHESVEMPPELMLAGLAESVQEGADGGGVVTMCTVVWHTAVPPGPVAVPV